MSYSSASLSYPASASDGRRQLDDASSAARDALLAARDARGAWTGRLSSSAHATATAISALALAQQHVDDDSRADGKPDRGWLSGVMVRNELNELFVQSLGWLAGRQNDDGGWGDTARSTSNLPTTMLVVAAFQLTGVPAKYAGILERAKTYIDSQGGAAALGKRRGDDRVFAAQILTNCALAGLAAWSKVPSLPFEAAALPERWRGRLGFEVLCGPTTNFALPAIVALGLAKFHHAPTWNPISRFFRRAAKRKSLETLEHLQAESGGFLAATPLTSFVVMSLASIGQADHPVVRAGVQFLLSTVRGDGSWPIQSDLAIGNTAQAAAALDWDFARGDFSRHADGTNQAAPLAAKAPPSDPAERTLDWLLACQRRSRPTDATKSDQGSSNVGSADAAAGGWACTDQNSAAPNADNTAAALLALAAWRRRWPEERRDEVRSAALAGIGWLLGLQNRDGGMPTYCRGRGKLPFDRSSVDVTAHTLRGLNAWRSLLRLPQTNPRLSVRIDAAIAAGTTYLETQQGEDGRWAATWFGNQQQPDKTNPVVGTAQALLMYQQLGRMNAEPARRGAIFLAGTQHASGGWGAADCPKSKRKTKPKKSAQPQTKCLSGDYPLCSVEETALAVEALLPFAERQPGIGKSVEVGIQWLCDAVEQDRYKEAAPIGFYLARLWYYESLYPQLFAARALRQAQGLARRE